MSEWWPGIVFGWPAITVAIGLAAAGIVREKWLWPVVAAVMVIPFSYYLAGSPTLGWLALTGSPLLAVTGIVVKYGRPTIAWLCMVPFVGVMGWLAIAVINQ